MDGRKEIEHGKRLNERMCRGAWFWKNNLNARLDAITLLYELLWMTVRSKAFDLRDIGCTSSSFLEMVFHKGENMG